MTKSIIDERGVIATKTQHPIRFRPCQTFYAKIDYYYTFTLTLVLKYFHTSFTYIYLIDCYSITSDMKSARTLTGQDS